MTAEGCGENGEFHTFRFTGLIAVQLWTTE